MEIWEGSPTLQQLAPAVKSVTAWSEVRDAYTIFHQIRLLPLFYLKLAFLWPCGLAVVWFSVLWRLFRRVWTSFARYSTESNGASAILFELSWHCWEFSALQIWREIKIVDESSQSSLLLTTFRPIRQDSDEGYEVGSMLRAEFCLLWTHVLAHVWPAWKSWYAFR